VQATIGHESHFFQRLQWRDTIIMHCPPRLRTLHHFQLVLHIRKSLPWDCNKDFRRLLFLSVGAQTHMAGSDTPRHSLNNNTGQMNNKGSPIPLFSFQFNACCHAMLSLLWLGLDRKGRPTGYGDQCVSMLEHLWAATM